MGRPQKPFKTSWGETIDGLYRRADGRWKILATREVFSEKDEYTAVSRFKASGQQNRTLFVPFAHGTDLQNAPEGENGVPYEDAESVVVWDNPGDEDDMDAPHSVGHLVDRKAFYEMVRKEIIETPDLAAQNLRIPQIASLHSLAAPQEPITLQKIIAVYLASNPSKPKSKQECLHPFKAMMKFTGARTLADLTTESLGKWKDHVEKTVPSPGSRMGYYNRIKTIIGFGLKVALDADQISRALLNCKILWTAERKRPVDPQPISRKDFHRLLEVGGDYWRPWLYCGINLCMHLNEICEIKWSELDFDAGTYASIRGKTAIKRIPRAATLWPETLEALRKVKRRGQSPYLFTSSHGTRFNRNTLGNHFKELRDKAGLPHIVFDALRDGAYSAACAANNVDDKWARLLAGHKAPGLQDNYVLRNPAIVKPACDAVYRHYFGAANAEQQTADSSVRMISQPAL